MSKQSEITNLQEENAKVSVTTCVSAFVLNDKHVSNNAIFFFSCPIS